MNLSRSVRAVLVCAFIGNATITAGIVLEAAVVRGAPPLGTLLRLLQWDASNALGALAFSGGWNAALLGFGMDLIVASAWATVLVVAWQTAPVVRRHVVVTGVFFGALVMIVMFYAIVPLGRAQPPSGNITSIVLSLIAHTVFFGVPVALLAQRIMGERSRDNRPHPTGPASPPPKPSACANSSLHETATR